MRNTIQIIDKIIPQKMVSDLNVGEMFKYPKAANAQNVYMKVSTPEGNRVVLLANGVMYTDFNNEKDIEIIDAITISR